MKTEAPDFVSQDRLCEKYHPKYGRSDIGTESEVADLGYLIKPSTVYNWQTDAPGHVDRRPAHGSIQGKVPGPGEPAGRRSLKSAVNVKAPFNKSNRIVGKFLMETLEICMASKVGSSSVIRKTAPSGIRAVQFRSGSLGRTRSWEHATL